MALATFAMLIVKSIASSPAPTRPAIEQPREAHNLDVDRLRGEIDELKQQQVDVRQHADEIRRRDALRRRMTHCTHCSTGLCVD